jgi:hypothetical protein
MFAWAIRLIQRRRSGLGRGGHVELRYVGAQGQFDANVRFRTFHPVLCKPLSHLIGGHPNGGIFPRVVCWRPVKYGDTDRPFFQLFGAALQGVFHNIL